MVRPSDMMVPIQDGVGTTERSPMRLALAQYALDSDIQRNFAKVLQLMHQAAAQKADLILFPELCLSPFFPQFPGQDATRYAMRVDDECICKLQATCRAL